MSKFKEMLDRDIKNVFLNADEFGEEHVIDGETVVCVFDNYMTDNRDQGTLPDRVDFADGIYRSRLQLYVKESDLGYIPRSRDPIDIDGKVYIVASVARDIGMLTITLEVNDT